MAECGYYPGTCLTEENRKKPQSELTVTQTWLLTTTKFVSKTLTQNHLVRCYTTVTTHTHMKTEYDNLYQILLPIRAKLYILPQYPCTHTDRFSAPNGQKKIITLAHKQH